MKSKLETIDLNTYLSKRKLYTKTKELKTSRIAASFAKTLIQDIKSNHPSVFAKTSYADESYPAYGLALKKIQLMAYYKLSARAPNSLLLDTKMLTPLDRNLIDLCVLFAQNQMSAYLAVYNRLTGADANNKAAIKDQYMKFNGLAFYTDQSINDIDKFKFDSVTTTLKLKRTANTIWDNIVAVGIRPMGYFSAAVIYESFFVGVLYNPGVAFLLALVGTLTVISLYAKVIQMGAEKVTALNAAFIPDPSMDEIVFRPFLKSSTAIILASAPPEAAVSGKAVADMKKVKTNAHTPLLDNTAAPTHDGSTTLGLARGHRG